MWSKFLLTITLLLSFLGWSQVKVQGIVFNDHNSNNKKDAREKGIQGISVTNGIDVVLTDAKGCYELPYLNDMVVSVIKPSGYAVPLNKNNQPLFYYIHKENPSSQGYYPGIKPTGKLPKKINFPLIKQQEKNNFSVLLFGDPQPNHRLDLSYYDKAVVQDLIGTKRAVFGISLGDLGHPPLFPEYIEITGKIGLPWYNVLGNHDMRGGKTDADSDDSFERYFGPTNYAFNYANAHFIVLDDVLYPDPRDGKGYLGGFREDILRFVENDLKHVPKDKLIVLSFHIPIYEFEPGPDQFRKGDVKKLLNLLKGYKHTLSLSGHTHSQNHHFFTPEEGWPNMSSFHHHYNPGAVSGDVYKGPKDRFGTPASTMRDGTPKGYAYLNIKGNAYDYEYVTTEDFEDKLNIHIAKIVPQTKKYRGEIVVNFYQGSPRDTVEYRVDNGQWHPLKKTFRYDAFLVDLGYEWDYAETLPWGIRLSTPLPSSHIWSGKMPSQFELGKHILEVRVKDWLGRVYSKKKSFTTVKNHIENTSKAMK